MPRWTRRVGQALRRVLGADVALIVGKCALAAGVSWCVASAALAWPSPAFAPFSAVLIVHSTVSQSLQHSVRYVLAMLAGVALAGVLTPLLGPGVVTFVAVVVLAMLLGQWPRLGSHGPQVAVAAMFAYQSLVEEPTWSASFAQLASITVLILLGAAIGVATTLLIMPPLRYRSAQNEVRSLARRVRSELHDLAADVRDGTPSAEHTQQWSRHIEDLPALVDHTRHNLDHAAETVRFNPRLLLRQRPSLLGYRHTITALSHLVNQLPAITRSLHQLAKSPPADHEHTTRHEQLLACVADVLEATADAAGVLGELRSIQDLQQDGNALEHCLQQGRTACSTLHQHITAGHLAEPEHWPAYEALHADARRLVENLADSERELATLTA